MLRPRKFQPLGGTKEYVGSLSKAPEAEQHIKHKKHMMCQGGLKVPGTALDANVLTKLQVAVEGDDEDRAVGFQMQEVGTRTDRAENPVVFMDISIGGAAARMTFELRKDIVPRTAENFRSLCAGDRPTREDGARLSYQGCVFHKVVKDFAVIGGDIAHHDGTGRLSVYGEPFADENFILRHVGPGILTCCNSGPDTNTSTFMVTTVEAPWLNGRCVAFGCLATAEAFKALEKLEACGTDTGRPTAYIQITECGQLFPPQAKVPAAKFLGSRDKL